MNIQTDWISRYRQSDLRVRNFIDGRWQPVNAKAFFDKYSPRDGQLLYQCGVSEISVVEDAVTSARRAFQDGRWSKLRPQHRRDVLLKLASLIDDNREELSLLESLDVGKPISQALLFDVPAASAYIRFCAEAADKVPGKVYAVDGSSLSYELRRPFGVVAGIIGWNFPLYLAATKIGPALATGNSLVLKPSEVTSLSAGRLAELAVQAGVPAGVLNVVHGAGALGDALAHHRQVDLLTFTGSSQTGKRLLIASGESNMKRLILECGGKAPNIVFDDCPDMDAVSNAVVARAFWNQGEVCSASSRVLIQESIKDQLLPQIIAKASLLRPGDPLRNETTFGALVSHEHLQKVLRYVDIGRKEGATIVHQPTFAAPCEGGFYLGPVIFDEVSPTQTIAQEEIFGPVLSIIEFRDEGQAVEIANATTYGLSAIVWTTDLGRAHRVSQGINAGLTVVNATAAPSSGPGVGVISVGGHKESGIGTEGGLEGVKQYLTKTVVQLFV